uniref:Uncharacterized protein n=1 Tax=Rhizophora mucronata TaxID=61149 RepID=A0A2P2J169_RHIMU
MSPCPSLADTFVDSIAANHKGKKVMWEDLGDGTTKIHVKVVKLYDNHVQYEGASSGPILMREILGKSEKDRKESFCGCIEDRVLDILQIENARCMPRRSIPTWQILLCFLYREGYWAEVSVSSGDSKYLRGILKPFTVSSALLSLTEDEFHPYGADSVICKPEIDLILCSQLVASQSSQSGPILSGKCDGLGHGKKRNERKLNKHQELSWAAFCKAALNQSQMVLEEVYFSRASYKSKKLKFLKCWIKQVKKFSHSSLTKAEGSMSHQDTPKEADNRLIESIQESEQPIASCPSVGDDSLTGASGVQDEIAVNFQSETMEGFFSNLPHKIQQGLESEEVNLGSLAERLVNSSIYWLCQKCAPENQSPSVEHKDDSARVIGVDLGKLFLREPKDLVAMYRNGNASFQESSVIPSEDASEKMMREYPSSFLLFLFFPLLLCHWILCLIYAFLLLIAF